MGCIISEHCTSLAVGYLISISQLKYFTDKSTIIYTETKDRYQQQLGLKEALSNVKLALFSIMTKAMENTEQV